MTQSLPKPAASPVGLPTRGLYGSRLAVLASMTAKRGLPLRTTHALPLASTMLLGRPPTSMLLIAVFCGCGVLPALVEPAVVVQRGRIVVEVRPQRRLVALALIGRHARERVVEHAAQGVDVGAGIEALAADLLGRDVAQRADPAAVARRARVRGHALGQPEVG